jgi:hypothetical protein
MTSIPAGSNEWNETIKLWNAVGPSASEIAAVFAAFPESRITHILPRLVMVRRAVAAHFYTDDLPERPRMKRARRSNRKADSTAGPLVNPSSSNATAEQL